jgi:hypothetical protein
MLKVAIFVLSVYSGESGYFLHQMTISDACPVQFWFSECQTFNEQEPFGIHYRCFQAPWECDDEILIQFVDDGITEYDLVVVDEDDVEIHSEPFIITDTKYEVSLILSALSPEICNTVIQLKIVELSSPEAVIARSDSLSVKQTQEGTIIIRYSNPRNYAGLVYSDDSPQTAFYLRVPAMFYHERQVDEDEVLSLTNQIVTQNNMMKTQRQLKTDSLPDYFHKKIQLVLKHQTVDILDRDWIKEEPYEPAESDRRNPLQKFSCWLTDRDSVQRNVL